MRLFWKKQEPGKLPDEEDLIVKYDEVTHSHSRWKNESGRTAYPLGLLEEEVLEESPVAAADRSSKMAESMVIL